MWFPEGEVVKVCQQSIHIVVLGFSSAIIADEDIRGEFKYKIVSTLKLCFHVFCIQCMIIVFYTHLLMQKHGEDVFVSKSHRRHKIKVGTVVRFSVKR